MVKKIPVVAHKIPLHPHHFIRKRKIIAKDILPSKVKKTIYQFFIFIYYFLDELKAL